MQVLLLEGEVRAHLLELAPHEGELQRALGLHLRDQGVGAVHQSRRAAQVFADDGSERAGSTIPRALTTYRCVHSGTARSNYTNGCGRRSHARMLE